MNDPLKFWLGFRLTHKHRFLLRQEAARLGVSKSRLVRIMIDEYFDRPLRERAKVLEPDLAELHRRILGS